MVVAGVKHVVMKETPSDMKRKGEQVVPFNCDPLFLFFVVNETLFSAGQVADPTVSTTTD
jgi:hypothetical protein